jgi:predicted AAA+ superfamily ATPase
MDIIRNEDINANIIYINKEDMAFSDIHTAEELNDYVISKSKEDQMNYIFIDEIQEIKDFRLAIRSLALNEDNDIYVTGSNSEVFSVDLANMLGGQIRGIQHIQFVLS